MDKFSNLTGGMRIKRLRNYLNYSQREFAEEFNVTHGAVALWESGEREVQGPVLRLLEVYEEELELQFPKDSGFGEIDRIIESRFARNLGMTRLASKAFSIWAGNFLKSKILNESSLSSLKKKAYLNFAKEIVETLSEMKGLPMKLGQIIGYHQIEMSNEVRDIFARLQTQSTFLSQKIVTEIIREELGDIPKSIFFKWNAKPFAAASIGQVHIAKLKSGESVAVKIQYPGIARTIRMDLKNIEFFTKLAKNLFGPTDAPLIVRELADRLFDECDYVKEADSQLFFAEFFKNRSEILIPRVYKEYSTKHVLSTDFVEAQSFENFLSSSTQDDKSRVGEILWQFYFESIFRARRINADPHPGNFLIQQEAVVFIDFGCSSRYSQEFIQNWKTVLLAAMNNEENLMIETLRNMKMIAGDSVDSEQLREIVKAIYEPYLQDGVYEFNHGYVKKSFQTWFLSSRSRQNFIFQSEWIFLTRILFGLSSILAMLGARSNWRAKLKHLLEKENSDPSYDFKSEKVVILPGARS